MAEGVDGLQRPAPGYGSAPLDMRPTLVESSIRTPVPTSNMPARPIFKQALDLGQARPGPTQDIRPVLVHVRGSTRGSSLAKDEGEEFFVHSAPMLLMPGTEFLCSEERAGRAMRAVNPEE